MMLSRKLVRRVGGRGRKGERGERGREWKREREKEREGGREGGREGWRERREEEREGGRKGEERKGVESMKYHMFLFPPNRGTEKQHVADDYAKRMHIGQVECQVIVM